MKDVWQYIDPSLPGDSISKLPDWPQEPEIPRLGRARRGARFDSNLLQKIYAKYSRLNDEYEEELLRRDHIMSSLGNMISSLLERFLQRYAVS
jgi:hypothetical protein